VKEGKWYFRQLFVNGQRRQRARAPNTGYLRVDGSSIPGERLKFKFHDQDIRPEWAGREDVEVVMPRAWTVVRYHILTVDPGTHMVTLSGEDVHYVDEKDARYWIENSKDALDSPGEWYLDRRLGVVYYNAFPGEDMGKVQVSVPALHQLMRFDGDTWGQRTPGGSAFAFSPVHDIRIRGLTFSYADWTMPQDGLTDFQGGFNLSGAIEASAASSISIENSTFSHLGEFAIDLGKACHDIRILGNEMQDLGGGAIKIGEPKVENNDFESTGNNVVSDNIIHDVGIVDPGADAVWLGESGDNSIVHNEIYNTRHSGIAVGWTWGYLPTSARANLIAFNHLHHIGLGVLGDFGCIYTLGVQPGTVVQNNLCHDVRRSETSYGGWGIYTDEGSSNLLIENNVVYRTHDAGYHHHFGQDNVIRNNIFALGESSQLRRTRNEAGRGFAFQHNIVYWNSGTLTDGEWTDNDFHFDNNLYFYVGQAGIAGVKFGEGSFEEWQKHGQDLHSLIADPLFVDPADGNFSLRPDSPAFRIGFEPIDMSTVGPRGGAKERTIARTLNQPRQ
jgi:parallel beta-helix repeat protein